MPLIQQKRRNLAPEFTTRIITISIIKWPKKARKKNCFYKHIQDLPFTPGSNNSNIPHFIQLNKDLLFLTNTADIQSRHVLQIETIFAYGFFLFSRNFHDITLTL
jgi:hypothetical protein